MQGAGRWLEALEGRKNGPVRLLFGRLGLVALCRPLSGGELDECLELGGVRGAWYALWLACDSLREAGARRAAAGEGAVDFDITEEIPHADALAAGGIIARLSGVGPAYVRQLEEDEDVESALEAPWEVSGEADKAENPFAPGGAVAFNEDLDGDWMAESGVSASGTQAWARMQSSGTPRGAVAPRRAASPMQGPAEEAGAAFHADFDGVWMGAGEMALDAGAWPRAQGGVTTRGVASPAGGGVTASRMDFGGGAALGQRDGGFALGGAPGVGALAWGGASEGELGAQADALAAVLAERLRDAAGNMD